MALRFMLVDELGLFCTALLHTHKPTRKKSRKIEKSCTFYYASLLFWVALRMSFTLPWATIMFMVICMVHFHIASHFSVCIKATVALHCWCFSRCMLPIFNIGIVKQKRMILEDDCIFHIGAMAETVPDAFLLCVSWMSPLDTCRKHTGICSPPCFLRSASTLLCMWMSRTLYIELYMCVSVRAW